MFFSPFLATRYLRPKRSFVSIITIISILGVSLGVWALVVVVAVFTGYGEKIKSSILGFEPHIVITAGGVIREVGEVYEELLEVEEFESVTPFVQGRVIMDFDGLRNAPTIRGILPPTGAEFERLDGMIAEEVNPAFPDDPDQLIKKGTFDVSDPYSCVVGDSLAKGMGIEVGSRLLLYSPGDMQKILDAVNLAEDADDAGERKEYLEEVRSMTAPQEVEVKGIFDSGYFQLDSEFIYTHLETAQVLYGFDVADCHGIAIRAVDPFKAGTLEKNLLGTLPQHLRPVTWMEMNRVLFGSIAAERQAMYLILWIITIVAAFGITNTMIIVTFQKRSEIGLLKAIGSTRSQITWVFVLQGTLVGVAGVILGFVIAQLTIWQRNNIGGWIGKTFGVDFFSEEMYLIDGGLPAIQTVSDTITICTGAFAACMLAALVPALIAASLQPAKALRSQ